MKLIASYHGITCRCSRSGNRAPKHIDPFGYHMVSVNINSDDNRRPDILIQNPFGGGAQIILDVAITGVMTKLVTRMRTRISLYDLDSIRKRISMSISRVPMVCLLYQLFSR